MKYLRRFLWFWASRLLIFTFCAALLCLGFYMALNMSNIYILLSDGMEARTEYILEQETATDLNEYFRDEFIADDAAVQIALSGTSPYIDYVITGYDYVLSVEWMWSWPWEDTATATVLEQVNDITGYVTPESQSLANEGVITLSPPVWTGGEYTVTLYRAGGRWKIAGLKQIRVLIPEEG